MKTLDDLVDFAERTFDRSISFVGQLFVQRQERLERRRLRICTERLNLGAQARPLAAQLAEAGFADVTFVDATTILKGEREFGVFLCTATKTA